MMRESTPAEPGCESDAPGESDALSELGELGWMSRGGQTGRLMRSIDWSRTAVGPIERWPRSLKTTVATLLHSRHPMFLWWGPELIQFYNDAYLPSFGNGKHPAAMGQRGRDCWSEIWPIISPQIDDVMLRGKASWNQDHLVPILRNGRTEEVYWTYGYSPVFDDQGAIGGVLVVCTETTPRVVAERRIETLRALAERTAIPAELASMLRSAAGVFSEASRDIPFALIYSLDQPAGQAELIESVGLPRDQALTLSDAAFGRDSSALALAGATGDAAPLRLAATNLPGGPWPEAASEAFVVPLVKSAAEPPSGFIAFGLSPRLPFDDMYRDYLTQLAATVALAQARLRAHEDREKLLAELESASRAKDEFLAMLGHELRNPLSPIVTALQLMKRRGDSPTSHEQRVIERQVNHLVRLVDDLLDVSKITRGKVDLRKEALDVGEVLNKAVEIASVLFEQRNHRLSIEVSRDVSRDDLRYEGDPVRLAQVVANLLTNAARYTAPGGQIRLAAFRDGDAVVISVKDNGAGISAEMRPRIFDLFVQGTRSTDRAEGGLGIGLTLVKNLVALHGGTVEALSDGPGKGSEFVIRLPLSSGVPAGAPHPRISASSPPEDRQRVLVVDDNGDAAELLCEVLRDAGHDVAVANEPHAALALVETFKPNVAVVDIGLPVMDGYQLAAQFRALAAGGRLRLIALSGYGQEHDRARSLTAGFERHLVKPVDTDELLGLISGPAPGL